MGMSGGLFREVHPMVDRPFQKAIQIFLVFFLVLLSIPTQAAVIDEVARDFKPISGYVIMEAGSEYLIDLDASKGVSAGDLFSVMQPGKKITHPVTGKVLGTLEEVKSILKVTRLQPGFSYARVLEKGEGIKRGDQIRRYENIPALFWDYTGKGESFYYDLRNILTSLKWQDYNTAQGRKPKTPSKVSGGDARLLFILTHEGFEVRDSEFQLIHRYGVPESLAAAGSAAAVTIASRPPSSDVRTAPAPSVPYKLEKGVASPKTGIAYEATFPGFQVMGTFPKPTLMADFVRDGDRMLLASTDGYGIRVYRAGEKFDLVAKGDTRNGSWNLAVQWWRPSGSSPLYLVVTALFDQQVDGTIFSLQGDRLAVVKERIPYFMGAFDRDGDGNPETLLRQSFDRDLFWGRGIRQLRLEKGELKSSRPDFRLPSKFNVLGSVFADLTGNGRLEAIVVRDKAIYIFAGKKELYQSPPGMGGSLSVASYDVNPEVKDVLTNTAIVEVSPVAADLDGDGVVEVVVVASESSLFTAPGIAPTIKNPRLAVLKYRNGTFVRGTIGDEVGGPVQGITVADGKLLFVTTNTGSLFGKGASTQLLAFQLAQP
jgi:hypothetical protein